VGAGACGLRGWLAQAAHARSGALGQLRAHLSSCSGLSMTALRVCRNSAACAP
jgi:hypothetical protein